MATWDKNFRLHVKWRSGCQGTRCGNSWDGRGMRRIIMIRASGTEKNSDAAPFFFSFSSFSFERYRSLLRDM